MKTIMSFVFALALLMVPCGAFAEENMTVTTTTQTAGTISELSPTSIIVKTDSKEAPMNYTYTKKTTYVDEQGAPVSMETVQSGLPVTVFYTHEGDKMIAEKVVVRKTTTTTTENPVVKEKTTTTTTENPMFKEKTTTTTTKSKSE